MIRLSGAGSGAAGGRLRAPPSVSTRAPAGGGRERTVRDAGAERGDGRRIHPKTCRTGSAGGAALFARRPRGRPAASAGRRRVAGPSTAPAAPGFKRSRHLCPCRPGGRGPRRLLERQPVFDPARSLDGGSAAVVPNFVPLAVPRLHAHHVEVIVVVKHMRQLALDSPVPCNMTPGNSPRLPGEPVVYPVQCRVEQRDNFPVVHVVGPGGLKAPAEPPVVLTLLPVPFRRRGRHCLASRS